MCCPNCDFVSKENEIYENHISMEHPEVKKEFFNDLHVQKESEVQHDIETEKQSKKESENSDFTDRRFMNSNCI